ncbi:MAG: cystathionine beta-lyase [Rhodospirillales bacterium]|mgnify:FL=1|jgi:cystathionine beta-lyase|nr:cystathionine beta-lyase [Rhodospirillaceae bacterium]MDP6430556.1 cystathionine beta-lyase [Rhodospirillales bacterium]MDP6644003.1 cystathionine beta-lyase [Rhodospirillales bacterium]MDP6841224.1 cystathionine beta-lyase [Rhodospirillales bacterium]|tara:strand:+ start:1274 stop:2443 length:1170 start_codon:yes stop_codon:yes gene_type:complete
MSGGKRDTRLIHAGSNPEENFGLINPPVYRASTVSFPTVAAQAKARRNPEQNFVYGRRGTPTSFAFEDAVAQLEGGDRTIAVGSGLAAISSAMLAFVSAGDHVLVCDNAYTPTRNLSENFLKRFGVETSYYDPMDSAAVKDHFRPNSKAIYVEAPGSHTFEVMDLPAIAGAARDAGIKVVMDNTWSAGYFFKPFEYGVDVSVQAATKYQVGHSDAMLGAVTMLNDDLETVAASVRVLGFHAAPDDAYLGLRGMRTLSVRLKRHEINGLKVAEWLAGRPEIERVLHPAMADCPGHEFWKRDFTGASGLFGVALKPAPKEAVNAFVDRLELFALGGSWGGYESLVLPTNVTRTASQLPSDAPLVRLHVGLEDPDDLIEDLNAGLDAFNDSR